MLLPESSDMKRRKLNTIDTITFDSLDAEQFYDRYVQPRIPVKIVDSVESVISPWKQFKAENLVEFLKYDEPLLIERKVNGGFGGGEKRCQMTLEELMGKFKNGDDTYYLTTQYDEHEADLEEDEQSVSSSKNEDDDVYELDQQLNPLSNDFELESEDEDEKEDDEEDSDFDLNNLKDDYIDSDNEYQQEESSHISDIFQPPLTNIYDQIPVQPGHFKNLIPQQINLWMGYTKSKTTQVEDPELKLTKYVPQGSSSGLHHDHSDNLYILIQGVKRFTLFKPQDAYNLYTIGNIFKIYNNGVIDYQRDEFAPKWNHINDDGTIIEDENNGLLQTVEAQLLDLKLDPPNFSRIPSILLHLNELSEVQLEKLLNFTKTNFPNLLKLDNFKVWLNPGDMLYLPAGWFHEVLSFGTKNNQKVNTNNDLDHCHVALNYWFAPPNGLSFNAPYKTSYWQNEFKKYTTT